MKVNDALLMKKRRKKSSGCVAVRAQLPGRTHDSPVRQQRLFNPKAIVEFKNKTSLNNNRVRCLKHSVEH